MAGEQRFLSLGKAAEVIESLRIGSEVLEVGNKTSLDYLGSNIAMDLECGRRTIQSKRALSQLKKLLGVDNVIFEEFMEDQDLVQKMLRHSLSKRQGLKLRAIYDADYILGFKTMDKPHVDLPEFFDLVSKEVGDKSLGVEEVLSYRGNITFKVLLQKNGHPLEAVGDLSHAGLFAEWNGKVAVSPYVCRLVCLNGMIGTQTVAKYGGLQSHQAIRARTRRVVHDVCEESGKFLDAFMKLSEREAENPERIVRHLRDSHHLRQDYAEDIIQSLPSLQSSPTLYDLLNMISAYANALDAEERDRLRRVGGDAVEILSTGHRCSQCFSLLDD